MVRPLRLNIENGLYHVTSRGNEKKKIYDTPGDKEAFLGILSKVVKRYGWLCHAYCLMSNHYHLMIETPKCNLSQGMRQLNGVYTQFYNFKHKRNGHLFQGRFKAILVEKEVYLLALIRYVVLNPVKAEICKFAGEYKWSSYNATAGKVNKPEFLFTDWILSQFDSMRAAAVKKYEQFISEGISDEIWDNLTGQIYLGRKEFVENMAPKISDLEEVPKIQQSPFRPNLQELLINENGILDAYSKHGYSMKEIAKYLNVHYATISRKLKKIELKRRNV